MPTPKNFHDIPDPHPSIAGPNLPDSAGSKLSLKKQARKYRPKTASIEEPEVATLSRFAVHLIDRETGKAFSAEQLGEMLSNDDINAVITLDPQATQLALNIAGVVVRGGDGNIYGFAPSADTDAARATAFDDAKTYADTLTGASIHCAPGDYYISKAATTHASTIKYQYAIKDRQRIFFNGARFYHTATEADRKIFVASLGTDNLAHDWGLYGPGILEGSDLTWSGTESGGDLAAASECGVHVAGASGYSYRYEIDGLTVRGFTDAGIKLNSAAYPPGTWKFTSGIVRNCRLDNNRYGLAGYSGHEFVQIDNCTANYCVRGFYADAGNWFFDNCQANACTSEGLYVHSSGNHAHGTWKGGCIAHNYNNSVRFATGVTNGWNFEGCNFGGSDGTTPNKLVLDGYGINIMGGQIDSPIYTNAVNGGFNKIEGVYISGNATSILTNLYSGSRAKFLISSCFTATGEWSENDNIKLYAELATDQTFQSDTVLRDVTGLTLTLPAGRYRLKGFCLGTPASSAIGVKINLSVVGTGTINGMCIGYQNTNPLNNGCVYYAGQSVASLSDTRTVAAGVNGQPLAHNADVILTLTGSTVVKYQIAQATSGAVNLTAEAGSYLLAERIGF